MGLVLASQELPCLEDTCCGDADVEVDVRSY